MTSTLLRALTTTILLLVVVFPTVGLLVVAADRRFRQDCQRAPCDVHAGGVHDAGVSSNSSRKSTPLHARKSLPVLQVAVAAQKLPDHDVHGLLAVAAHPLLVFSDNEPTIQMRLSGDNKHHALGCGSTTTALPDAKKNGNPSSRDTYCRSPNRASRILMVF